MKNNTSLIKQLRFKCGFTQKDLGELIFCSQNYVSKMELKQRKPNINLMKRIKDLGCRYGFKITLKQLEEEFVL